MAYSTNPNLPKARAVALRLLLKERLPVQTVANKCGVHRSTVYRWKLKWLKLNSNQQLVNYNRPSRSVGHNSFRLGSCRWRIVTLSSRPHHSPKAVPGDVVTRVLELRRKLKRCAEIVWYYARAEGLIVSLSSVRRILKRSGIIHGRKKRVRRDNPRRPLVTRPGELVQTDTVHYVCPYTKRRRYAYTVIDLYTRMAYVEFHDHIGPGIAAKAILSAQEKFGFTFYLVQSDNGTEFSSFFENRLHAHGIQTRHSRLHRPNDNAHIERFNRTIQEECTGRILSYKTTTKEIQARLTAYLDFYNTKRIHLGLQLRTPVEMLQRC